MKLKIHSTWRSKCETYTVELSQSCFDEMRILAHKHLPNEVGTALVGAYSDDGHIARITGLAPLTSDSHGARTTFRRGVQGLVEFFRGIFRSSNGMTHYIGDWHSHPGGAPQPSRTDDENALETARDPKSYCPECIQVILGVDDQTACCRVFVYSRTKGRLDLVQSPLDDDR